MYCVKCKAKTKDSGSPQTHTAKNGRKYKQVPCSVCGTKKTQFVK